MSEANKINLINICDSCICVHGVLLQLSVFKSKSAEGEQFTRICAASSSKECVPPLLAWPFTSCSGTITNDVTDIPNDQCSRSAAGQKRSVMNGLANPLPPPSLSSFICEILQLRCVINVSQCDRRFKSQTKKCVDISWWFSSGIIELLRHRTFHRDLPFEIRGLTPLLLLLPPPPRTKTHWKVLLDKSSIWHL